MDNLYGRTKIEMSVEMIDASNVLDILSQASSIHETNVNQINSLYEYYKGKHDVQNRTKEVRPEILNKVTVNIPFEIVNFKKGYLIGDPTQYIGTSDEVTEKVVELNKYMEYLSKSTCDDELIEWNTICGTAYQMCIGVEDDEECPFEIDVLDPRNAFVIYSTAVNHKALAGVYTVKDAEGNTAYKVYTPETIFTIVEDDIAETEANPLGMIPIIEYPANNARLGAFEPVISLIDCINNLESNRMDSVEQFVQSLLVIYNAEMPEDTTANSIREAGMVILRSINENKADIKVISEVLNQTETQTFKEDLYKTILTICSMPNRNGGSSTSDTGMAVVYRDGWSAAETAAKASEAMYKKSDKEFRKVMFALMSTLNLVDLTVGDVVCNFTRHPAENIEGKSAVLIAMLNNDKIHPHDAYTASGMFVDAETAYRNGMEWYEQNKASTPVVAEEEAVETTADATAI